MSSPREPMWYCHECNAEMRPLMMPDPHCASCRGTFVEKIENLNDDPREFHTPEADLGEGLGPLAMLASLHEILRDHSPPGADSPGRRAASSPTRDQSDSPSQGMGLRFEFGSPNSRRTFILGGPSMTNRRDSETNARASTPAGPPPRLSEFLRASNESNGSEPRDPSIPGHLMAQYLLALLGGGLPGARGLSPVFGPMGSDEHGSGQGRWGDYVFTQEALDQIITQMMEGANSTRPVPATEEIVEKLPREVLERGNPLLEKDCAVCKEQFNAEAEDPDEQVVVTLPCKHPFHEGCIIPWLKSSGTCPVCRFALVPQPNAHSTDTDPGPHRDARPSSSGNGSSPGSRGSAPGGSTAPTTGNTISSSAAPMNTSTTGSGSHGGFFSNLFGGHSRTGSSFGRSRSPRSASPPSTLPSRDRRQNRGSRGSSGDNSSDPRIPGSWGDSLD